MQGAAVVFPAVLAWNGFATIVDVRGFTSSTISAQSSCMGPAALNDSVSLVTLLGQRVRKIDGLVEMAHIIGRNINPLKDRYFYVYDRGDEEDLGTVTTKIPPGFNGKNVSLITFGKRLERWDAATEIPQDRRGNAVGGLIN